MFRTDIEKITKENTNFRRVLYTGKHSQLVIMNIPVGEEIGEETHPKTDQILFFVEGSGQAIVGGDTRKTKMHDVVFVPAGTKHNFKNTAKEDLKLYTIYSPPAHPDGTIHRTRTDAMKEERY